MLEPQHISREKAQSYCEEEGLAELISFEPEEGIIAPQIQDLARLHQLIRKRKSFTVLEFGVGYSTIVIADALKKNQAEWSTLDPVPAIRNRYVFQCFSVDTSEDWIALTNSRIPEHLKEYVHFQYSEVEIGTHLGQLCHFYKTLPDVVPDFIYLDGPDPKAVKGNINGLTFQCDERTVMAADLLLMESTMLPGTFILVDGRTNNARFLQRNFRRNFDYRWHQSADVSTFELQEKRLGKYNLLGSDFL
ncbi:MAG: hypothetical protein AAFY36_04230 [Bacteroidota bacterium]